MKNIITIDVEDWYQTMDFNIDVGEWDKYEDRLEYGMESIIELLEKYEIKATFFVLGYMAKKHPEMIRKLADSGHEIGCHGGFHRMVTAQTMNEFREDIRWSKGLLEHITGVEVKFHRSSSWSITSKTLWALNVLEEEGFSCDSSIQPFKTPLSGVPGAPTTPYYPVVNGKKLGILEVPPTVLQLLNMCIPFSGGLYLRVLPKYISGFLLSTVNKRNAGMLYIHPWEMDYEQPRLNVKPHIKFVHYYNLKNNIKKLEYMLLKFTFGTLGEALKDRQFPCIEIK